MNKTFFSTLIMGAACALVFMSPLNAISVQKQILLSQAQGSGTQCNPTPSDYLGPFYKAGAPVRASVGKGYELKGVVKSAEDCAPIANTKIELWLTNSEGDYDDDHRATLYSDDTGSYSFQSNFPPGYSGRPPHIHIKISAAGFKTLATQHYPVAGRKDAVFDIVLVPTH
jgi:protocatechuate 3,4-dioxygenase beta subunit